MITINNIEEPVSYLYKEETLVGMITSGLQLNDCLVQIMREKEEGYILHYEGIKYPIDSDGRIRKGGDVYPLIEQQMKEIMGF